MISCYGVVVGVRTNQPDFLAHIVERLPAVSEPLPPRLTPWLYSLYVGPPSPRPRIKTMSLLYRNGTRVARAVDRDEVVEALEEDLASVIATSSPSRVFLSGVGVVIDDRAVVVTGAEGQGVEPLARALVDLGATPWADPWVPLDETGVMDPFLPSGALNGPPESVPIAAVVLTDSCRSGGPGLADVGPAFATLDLTALVQAAQSPPGMAVRAIAGLTRRATVLRTSDDDPRAAAVQLRRIVCEGRE